MTDETYPVATHQAKGVGRAEKIWQPPARNILADDIYEVIKEGLLANRFAPGERLNLDQIARELKVSNTPVRQALARLTSEGLVTNEPYRGFRASMLLDSRGIEELYEYRLFVEPPTAANAARRNDQEGVADLASICDPSAAPADLSGDDARDTKAQRDINFHLRLARISGNRVVTDHLERTYTRMRLYNLYNRHDAATQTGEEHQLIVDAIRRGDPDAAATAMRDHLTSALDRLRQALVE
ncbi:GntR family transcriptional regulator [Streptomyces nigrescens]|uniref:GntR family transcriptional regulator n=1 Tax=Streptomyces nigrescens TaxID=1920 RepID=A0ABY7IXQ5_STRNI|nr:GntR family transcriptional regulator [Streptomyces nigrescens]WAU03767.1 GntR family transcriptional regulator [Streptomyces nigrescens]